MARSAAKVTENAKKTSLLRIAAAFDFWAEVFWLAALSTVISALLHPLIAFCIETASSVPEAPVTIPVMTWQKSNVFGIVVFVVLLILQSQLFWLAARSYRQEADAA